jgi:hypothetical protein
MALCGKRNVDGAACLQKCIKCSYFLNTDHKVMEVLKFPFSYTLYLEQDGTHTETRFCLSIKWTSPCHLVGVTGQSTAQQLVAFVLCWIGHVPRLCKAYWIPTPLTCSISHISPCAVSY